MRFIAFIALIGAAVGLSTPASAAWETYVFEDLHITKEFPAPPERSETIYTPPIALYGAAGDDDGRSNESGALVSGIGTQPEARREIETVESNRPAVEFMVEVDNIVHRMTVVDLQDRLARGASVVLECIALYEEVGDLVSNFPATTGRRLDPQGGTYGREVTIDLPDNRGRVIGACYFTRGHLYRFEAHILPENGNMFAIDAVRFTNAVEFHYEGGGAR